MGNLDVQVSIRPFWSPYKILPIAQENKYMYLGKFSYFIMKL